MDKPTVLGLSPGGASGSGKNSNDAMTENRVKIYDFFSDDSAGKYTYFSRDYLWPVLCYTVHVNLQHDSRNNIIENAVGRMLKVKQNDVKAAAESLCLDQDLVAFIAGRIKNSNKNSDPAVSPSETDDDEDVYNPRSCMEEENDECSGDNEQTFYSIKMFRDAAGSETLLPFAVPSSEMYSKEIKQRTGEHITYALDNEGKEVRRVRLIPRDLKHSAAGDFDDQGKFKNAEVFAGVLQRYVKKCAKNNIEGMIHLNGVAIEKFLRNPRVKPDLNPELAYIRVNIRMESSTFSFMVSDFTGTDYFRELTRLVNKSRSDMNSRLSKKIRELHDEFLQEQHGNFKEKRKDADENLPQSVRMFNAAVDAYYRIPWEIQGDADNEKYREELYNYFSSVYSSVEDALYEVFRTYGNVPSKMCGEGTDKTEISIILKKYGIELRGGSDDISFVSGSSVFRISNISENHDMQTVIYLCLCQAAQNTDHPIIVLLQRFPDFVSNIRNIKGARDRVSHGSNVLKVDAAVLKKVLKAVSAYLSQLVVGYEKYFTGKNAEKKTDPQLHKELIDDLPEMAEANRFRARYDLENILGISFVSDLDPDLTSSLMNLFQHFNSLASGGADIGLKKYKCIAEMYKILETVFSELVAERIYQSHIIIRDTDINQIIDFMAELTVEDDSASEETGHSGKLQAFTVSDSEAKKQADTDKSQNKENNPFAIIKDGSLATARPRGVVKVLTGGGASLQAAVLAFLYITPKVQLQSYRNLFDEYEFDVIGFLEKLIELRGHGLRPIDSGVNMRELFRNFLFLFKMLKEN